MRRAERAGQRRNAQRGWWPALGALALCGAYALTAGGSSGADATSTSTSTSSPPTTASTTSSTLTTSTLTTSTLTTSTTTPRARTWLGSYGVVSSATLAENARPGTTAWQIPPGDDPTAIQGFADHVYAADGQSVGLYVSTRLAHWRVIAFRMGYYHGRGARAVWQSTTQVGLAQPACTIDSRVNMVSCANWRLSLRVHLTKAFVPGDYLLKLDAGSHAQSYVPLTIWDPSSRATYVISNRSMVEQGWNTYGGYSFYAGTGPCILDTATYPVCNRARVVSFDRPYSTGLGASDFLSNEYPLVRLCEQYGLDVTYVSDVTINDHPSLLLAHRVLLSLDHDETWTYAERLGVQAATQHGVNVVYFGAAAMVRHARLQASPLGPNREEVDYRNAYEDPLNGVGDPHQVTGNTWWDGPAPWPPLSQIGVNYSGYLDPGVSVPLLISDASSWVFAGTGLSDGSSLPGAIGSDFDHVIGSTLTPSNLQVLAHSPIPAALATVAGGVWAGYSYSDMVYFTDPRSQAGVLDTGDNIWIADLRACARGVSCAAPTIARITGNILRVFGRAPAGRVERPVPNLASISPAGS